MVYSQVWGTGAQEALLLHCSLASSDAWRGLAAHLADGLTMTGFDFLGHGQSADWDGSGDYHSLCTQDAEAFLERPMHLIGHSFGATVALRLALEHPTMVRSLTLIEPVFFAAAKGSEAYVEHMSEMGPFVDAMQREAYETAARLFTDEWGTGGDWAMLPAAMRAYMTARIRLVLAVEPAIYGDSAGMAAAGRLETVGCPVLLIEGSKSPSIVSVIHAALAARLPDALRVSIKGASHMAPITHSAQVAEAISGFLKL